MKKEDEKKETPAVTPPVKNELSPSERFTKAITREFENKAGDGIQISNFQRKLCQNYFIKIDMMLKESEVKRMVKSEQYRDALEYSWKNINMEKLAIDIIPFSGVGLDPMQPNHINLIPYKNNKANKYDIGFIPGYRGLELKAKKYGFEIPDDVIVELVYKNDIFKIIKKDTKNRVESYTFDIIDAFNRGELVGGFYCHVFYEHPEKNRVKEFSKSEIDKRKPKNASAEFWGGEKDKWERGQNVGKETIDGWYNEMAYKTIYRAAYNSITIDSEKIDANYISAQQKEDETNKNLITIDITDNANKEIVSFEEVQEVPKLEIKEEPTDEEFNAALAKEENKNGKEKTKADF